MMTLRWVADASGFFSCARIRASTAGRRLRNCSTGLVAFGNVAPAAGGGYVVRPVGTASRAGHDVVQCEWIVLAGAFAAVLALAAIAVVHKSLQGSLVQRALLVFDTSDVGVSQPLDVKL